MTDDAVGRACRGPEGRGAARRPFAWHDVRLVILGASALWCASCGGDVNKYLERAPAEGGTRYGDGGNAGYSMSPAGGLPNLGGVAGVDETAGADEAGGCPGGTAGAPGGAAGVFGGAAGMVATSGTAGVHGGATGTVGAAGGMSAAGTAGATSPPCDGGIALGATRCRRGDREHAYLCKNPEAAKVDDQFEQVQCRQGEWCIGTRCQEMDSCGDPCGQCIADRPRAGGLVYPEDFGAECVTRAEAIDQWCGEVPEDTTKACARLRLGHGRADCTFLKVNDCYEWCVADGPEPSCGGSCAACVLDLYPSNPILPFYSCYGEHCQQAPYAGTAWRDLFDCSTIDFIFNNWVVEIKQNQCEDCQGPCAQQCL